MKIINLFFAVFLMGNISLMADNSNIEEQNLEISDENLMIKEMQLADIDKLKSLFEKCQDISSQTGIYPSDIPNYVTDEETYKVYICKNKQNEDICGFLIAINNKDSFYVRALGVDKDYRRLGIATKLLKAVYGFAENNNYQHLTIHASNDIAKKCYEKFGFRFNSLTGALTITFIKLANPC